MSFTDIKTKSQGFTIVELLIVVVVIAILAAITIVSYNGITNRANDSAAESLASTWRKKVELYYSENGRYPISMSEMSASANDAWYITNSSVVSAVTSDNGKSKVQVEACAASGTTAPTASTVTTIRVTYWNYYTGTLGATPVIIGSTTTATGAGCTTFS